VSVTQAVPGLIRVEAVDINHAGSLVQALVRIHEADEVSPDGDNLEVHIRTRGDSNRAVVQILDTVEAWLAADGLESTMIHLEGRSYRLEAPA
jgi:hypothetical protein